MIHELYLYSCEKLPRNPIEQYDFAWTSFLGMQMRVVGVVQVTSSAVDYHSARATWLTSMRASVLFTACDVTSSRCLSRSRDDVSVSACYGL